MGIFNNRFTARLLGLAIIGVIFIGMGLSSLFGALSFKSSLKKNIKNEENIIDLMYPSDYELNDNVCGYISYLFECFCEETTTNTVNGVKTSSRVSGSYYLMPILNTENDADNISYITVLVKDKDVTADFEQLVDDTYNYLGGNDDVTFHDILFAGKVKPLEDDVKKYLVEWTQDVGFFEDNSISTIDKYVLPYQIEEYNIENHYYSAKTFLPIGGGIVAICALLIFLTLKKSKKQEEEQDLSNINTNEPNSYDLSYKPDENTADTQQTQSDSNAAFSAKPQDIQHDNPIVSAPVAVKAEVNESNTSEVSADNGMLSAAVSAEDVDNLPDDSSAKQTFNYDDGGMGGIDVSALDLSSLDDYKDENASDESADNNIYSSDDEEYTFDADPSSIQLSDMDQ